MMLPGGRQRSQLKLLRGRTWCGRRVWRELELDTRPVVVKRGDGGFGLRALFCPPSPRGSATHSLTRQILDKRPPVRAPGTAQSGKTEVGKQCPTSQSIPGCGTPSPDVELRPRMWNSIPGCGNLQLNCTRLGSLGGPVVKTSPSDAGRVGLIPPGGAGAAHALWPKKPRCRTEPIL